MSTTQLFQPASIALGEVSSHLFRRAGHVLAFTWRVVSTRRELLEMDERMLKDIGISRAQANFEANRWFWK